MNQAAAPSLALELLGHAPTDQSGRAHMLGLLCYGEPVCDDPSMPCAQVGLAVLGAGASMCEAWRSARAPRDGIIGRLHYREDGNLFFGCLRIDESRDPLALQHAAASAYADVFAALDALGYPHLVRCWNYMTDINGESDGLERYRQFNIGRQQGFACAGRAFRSAVPAACALGGRDGPLVVAVLAARSLPVAVENPRQVPAYEYPPDYGPQAPTFARASLLPTDEGEILFISGTASIVGHRTVHDGDAVAQTAETLANLRAVIDAANRASRFADYTLDELVLKVYLRRRGDLAAVRECLNQHLPSLSRTSFLEADICRADLLVEIEAWARRAVASASDAG